MSQITAALAVAARPQAVFDETEFLHDESDADYAGFAPAQWPLKDRLAAPRAPKVPAAAAAPLAFLALDDDWTSAARATACWVEEQEAKARDAARLAHAAKTPRTTLAATAASSRLPMRRGWLARFEDALDRMRPGKLASLLQLFICVSLSMALIPALLPLVDQV